jgi:uncharacterized repeat protein (TIGR04138 family)
MQTVSFEGILEQILVKDKRYHRDAYLFVREALDRTRKIVDREAKAEKLRKPVTGEEKHVTGQELLAGIRELALETFGPMAVTVFEEWGVRSCRDFGEMVFIMVEHKLLKKTEKDTRGDFEDGYDFFDAFQKPFLPRDKIAEQGAPPKATKA